MVGFSVLFPLFPSMLDYYLEREATLGGGIVTEFVQLIEQFSFSDQNSSSFRFEIVIFGGALGSLYAILHPFFLPCMGKTL